MLNDLLQKLTDLPELIQWAGYLGMALIIFAETGLLFGIFLPGDSLLVTAGLLASQGYGNLNVWLLGVILNVAATAGNQTGYWIGRKAGPKVFVRDDSVLFKRQHVERAHAFYAKHGGKTIIIARFVPIVRTLAPVVAGVGMMNYRTFVFYDIVGGIGWVWSTLLAGYYLGRLVPGIEHNLEYVILLVIFLSISPGIIAWWREKRARPTPAAD
jgi:membrane-associated protein